MGEKRKQGKKGWFCNSPGGSPRGIAWDGKNIWVSDLANKKLYRLESKRGSIEESFLIDLDEPKGLTWDGSNLWISDNKTKKIYRVDPTKQKIISSIKASLPERKVVPILEDVAWDGKYIWVAYFAGWSSKFVQIDSSDGSTIQSFFCGSHPRGLELIGKHLFSIRYNGKRFPSTIDRRVISKNTEEIEKSHVFLMDIPSIKNPRGLTFDGKSLLITDEDTSSIFKVEVEGVH